MKAIDIEDLEPGMILARTIVNEDMVIVLSENTEITKAHITRLHTLDLPTVYIKDEYELSSNFQNVAALFSPSNAFVSEYKEIIHTAKEIFETASVDPQTSVRQVDELAVNSLSPMVKQSGVIDYLFELNHLATDVYNHSLRVSILAGVIGKWLYMSPAEIHHLIMAGFLHDIGKTKFNERLLGKNVEFLKGEDVEAYKRHTVDGYEILRNISELPEGVKLAALQHHEASDGNGYPNGKSGNDIHDYAKIVAVVNYYDNITTEREGFKKVTPFEAVHLILQEMHTRLDPKICIPFIHQLKDSCLGSRVRLSDNEIGTIVRYEHDFGAEPLIKISDDIIIDLNTRKDLHIIEYNPKQQLF